MPTTTRPTPAIPADRAPTGAEPDAGFPRRWQMLPVVLSAMFMAMFDFFVVNVAGPSLQHDLHASSAGLELVISAYTFTYAATVVIGGRLGDLIGAAGDVPLGHVGVHRRIDALRHRAHRDLSDHRPAGCRVSPPRRWCRRCWA